MIRQAHSQKGTCIRLFSLYGCTWLLTATLSGCGTGPVDTESRSDSLLVAVLSDLYLNEADLQLRYALESESVDSADSMSDLFLGAPVRDSVLGAHGLTEAEFQTHIEPYLDAPDELVKLYDRVLDRLNLERQQTREP